MFVFIGLRLLDKGQGWGSLCQGMIKDLIKASSG